jgi:lysophospholipase L1-like esterase
MQLRSTVLCLALALSATAAAQDGVLVAPTDPDIAYVGRFDLRDPHEARAAWPGTMVTLRFSGTGLSATLRTIENGWVQVVVDGKPTKSIEVAKAATSYVVAEGLRDGEHTVTLCKRTEAWSILGFGGFTLPSGATALKPTARPDRRIEVYGDSITCGYGNEAASAAEHFSAATANAWLAYGSVAARTLGAEPSLIAVSGIKLAGDNALPPRHDDILRPWDGGTPKADWSAWVPQVVVINLGTNDFGGGIPDEHAWCDAMRAFVTTLRGHYHDAHVYLATGPMLTGDALETLKRWLDGIAADAAKAGDARIHRIDFPPQRQEDGFGADWHPSVKTHQRMAELLAEAVRRDLSWK